MKTKSKKAQVISDYILITIGSLLVTFGVYFFKFPNNFCIGGVTGLGILGSHLTHGAVSSGTIILIVNMLLLVVGYLSFGKSFGIKTTYGSILMSVGLRILEVAVPMNHPLTDEPMLELFFAVVLPGVGAALLFNLGSSTGGTDVIAMLLRKSTNLNIGQALLASDIILTLMTFPFFGIKTGLLSVTGLMMKSIVIDSIVESLNLCKYFTIICNHSDKICNFIIHKLNRSATVFDATGAFSDSKKEIVLTVLTRSQALQLQHYIKTEQPEAFLLITNTSEIIGKGFRGF